MCIEDVKIGRATRAALIATVISNATVTEILPEDRNRYAIVIGAPSAGTAFISDKSDVTVLTGIPIATGQAPLVLDIKTHGEIVRCKLFALASAGTPSMSVLYSSFHLADFERQKGGK